MRVKSSQSDIRSCVGLAELLKKEIRQPVHILLPFPSCLFLLHGTTTWGQKLQQRTWTTGWHWGWKTQWGRIEQKKKGRISGDSMVPIITLDCLLLNFFYLRGWIWSCVQSPLFLDFLLYAEEFSTNSYRHIKTNEVHVENKNSYRKNRIIKLDSIFLLL